MQMQNGQHVDIPFLRMEVHAIGKVTEQRTVHLVFHVRELSWIVYDTKEHLVELIEELRSSAGLLVFIPHGCCLDVEVRLRLDDEPPCHPSDQRSRNLCSMSVRTSVQSRPALGSALYAAKRSRMICRCHSGTGTCSEVAAIRSQTDCTKSICSSTERSSNPGGGVGTILDIERTPTMRNISQTEGQEKRASLAWIGYGVITDSWNLFQLQLRRNRRSRGKCDCCTWARRRTGSKRDRWLAHSDTWRARRGTRWKHPPPGTPPS